MIDLRDLSKTFGPTPALIASVTKLGTKKWLEQQLAPSSIPDPAGDAVRALYPESQWTVAQVYQQVAAGKIGAPFQPELAMGAVVDGSNPVVVRNEDVIRLAGVSDGE